jgi:hypothetical protein
MKAGPKINDPRPQYPKGFNAELFRGNTVASQNYAHGLTRSQGRALGLSGAEYDALRLRPGVSQANGRPMAMLARDPGARGVSRDVTIPIRQQAADARNRYLNIFDERSRAEVKEAGRSARRYALSQARNETADASGAAGRRSLRQQKAASRMTGRALRGGWRMGLAAAGASGTVAGGIAAKNAWERRNKLKSQTLPRPSWERMNDDERKAAVPREIGGWANNRGARPTSAIGSQGRAGRFS